MRMSYSYCSVCNFLSFLPFYVFLFFFAFYTCWCFSSSNENDDDPYFKSSLSTYSPSMNLYLVFLVLLLLIVCSIVYCFIRDLVFVHVEIVLVYGRAVFRVVWCAVNCCSMSQTWLLPRCGHILVVVICCGSEFLNSFFNTCCIVSAYQFIRFNLNGSTVILFTVTYA